MTDKKKTRRNGILSLLILIGVYGGICNHTFGQVAPSNLPESTLPIEIADTHGFTFTHELQANFDAYVDEQIGPVSVDPVVGTDYWILDLLPGNRHTSRRSLVHYIDEVIIIPLIRATLASLPTLEIEVDLTLPIIWPGSTDTLEKVLRIRNPLTVTQTEYDNDQKVREHLSHNGLELPQLRFLLNTDEDRDDGSNELVYVIAVKAKGKSTAQDIPLTRDEVSSLAYSLQHAGSQNILENTSDHIKYVYTFLLVDLQKEADDILDYWDAHDEDIHIVREVQRSPHVWKAYYDDNLDRLSGNDLPLESIPNPPSSVHADRKAFASEKGREYLRLLIEHVTHFPVEFARAELQRQGNEISVELYRNDEDYRQTVHVAHPEVAHEIDYLLETRDDANEKVWEQIGSIANTGLPTLDPECEELVQTSYGIELDLETLGSTISELPKKQKEQLKYLALALVKGAEIKFQVPNGYYRFHMSGSEDRVPEYLVRFDPDSGAAPEVLTPVAMLDDPIGLLEGIYWRKKTLVDNYPWGPTVWAQFVDDEHPWIDPDDGSLAIVTDHQFEYLRENQSDQLQAADERLQQFWEVYTGTYLTAISLASIFFVGPVVGVSTRAATGLTAKMSLTYATGVTLVAGARSIQNKKVILPSAHNLTIDALSFGLLVGSGSVAGAAMRKMVPRLGILLSNTLGISTVTFAGTAVGTGNISVAGLSAIKIGAFSLFGGFAGILGGGSGNLVGLGGGLRFYAVNAAVSGTLATVEYKTIGYVDPLGYTADSLAEAVGIDMLASGPIDIAGARWSTQTKDPRTNRGKDLSIVRRETAMLHNSESAPPEFRRKIGADVLVEHNTLRIAHKTGRLRPDAQVRMLFLHGLTAEYSNSSSVRSTLMIFADPDPPRGKSTQAKLRGSPNYVSVAGEAIDLPGHGAGPSLNTHYQLDRTVDWLANYVRQMRQETPDLPLVIFTRSGSGVIASALVQKYPDLVDGLVMMSPPYPGSAEFVDANIANLKQHAKSNNFVIYDELMEWSRTNRISVNWNDWNFSNKPVLILTGSQDAEMLPAERKEYRHLADRFDNIEYIDVADAEHDVFQMNRDERDNPSKKQQRTAKERRYNTANRVYEFLQSSILNN